MDWLIYLHPLPPSFKSCTNQYTNYQPPVAIQNEIIKIK